LKREARDKRDLPHPKPVERIELNEENAGRKLIIAVVLLLFGAGMLVYAFMGLLTPETGWQTIEVSGSGGPSCGEEFIFLYELNNSAEAKMVTDIYTDACQKAFRLFNSDQEYEDVTNVRTINLHPNEVLEIDEGLYKALACFPDSGRRELYLGPVYTRYDDLFFCEDDSQLVDFDPRLNEAVRQEYGEIAAFAGDAQAIDLELLENNRICLRVSDHYLAYAQENGVDRFIDFSWMRNAFVADYLADALAAEGFTKGTLSSYDGFTRNLDVRETDYSFSILDLWDQAVCPAATMHYQGPRSLVTLRDYPLNDSERWRFYELKTGEVRTLYLDIADGFCRSAVHSLTCYSTDQGCGETLLAMLPVYIADGLLPEELARLAEEGVQSIYCQDRVIWHTDPALELEGLFTREDVQYTEALLKP